MDTLLHVGLSNAAVATALAVVAAAAGWAGRRPALTHGLWLLVLLKLVTPPIWPVPIGWRTGPEEAPAAAAAPAPPAEPDEPAEIVWLPADADLDLLPAAGPGPEHPPAAVEPVAQPPQPSPNWDARLAALPWKPALGAAWLAGSVCWLGLTAYRAGRFRRLLRHALPAPA
ncbi:MAG TPA: hypothetical protein VFA26_23175, partial [Gemmataceae bacterium]|nr:hypothetical protein [Gemmataceae bacterium]